MNLQKGKKTQEDAMQAEKKSIAFKSTRDYSTQDRTLRMMMKTMPSSLERQTRWWGESFTKRRDCASRTSNRKKPACFACNKPGHIKKDCPMLRTSSRSLSREGWIGAKWLQREVPRSKLEHHQSKQLEEVEDCATLQVKDAYIEHSNEYKKLSKRFSNLQKEHASCSFIYLGECLEREKWTWEWKK